MRLKDYQSGALDTLSAYLKLLAESAAKQQAFTIDIDEGEAFDLGSKPASAAIVVDQPLDRPGLIRRLGDQARAFAAEPWPGRQNRRRPGPPYPDRAGEIRQRRRRLERVLKALFWRGRQQSLGRLARGFFIGRAAAGKCELRAKVVYFHLQ